MFDNSILKLIVHALPHGFNHVTAPFAGRSSSEILLFTTEGDIFVDRLKDNVKIMLKGDFKVCMYIVTR